MNWTVFFSVLVGAMLGTGITLVFVPRKVTYHGVSLEKYNNLVAYYNELDVDLVELRGSLIELDERFLSHTHAQPNPRREVADAHPRREVTGYIQPYDDPSPRRTSRNLNPNTRVRRGG